MWAASLDPMIRTEGKGLSLAGDRGFTPFHGGDDPCRTANYLVVGAGTLIFGQSEDDFA